MVFVFEGVVVDLNEVELKNKDKNEADAASIMLAMLAMLVMVLVMMVMLLVMLLVMVMLRTPMVALTLVSSPKQSVQR